MDLLKDPVAEIMAEKEKIEKKSLLKRMIPVEQEKIMAAVEQVSGMAIVTTETQHLPLLVLPMMMIGFVVVRMLHFDS